MKCVIEFSVRTAGLTHEQKLAHDDALIEVFGKWVPPEGFTIHAFVGSLNGARGWMIAEAADPGLIGSELAKFVPFNDFDVTPVIDAADAVANGVAARAWIRSSMSS